MADQHQLQLLALHGWRTNPQVIAFQTALLKQAIETECQCTCHFHYIQAPNAATGPAQDAIRSFFGDQRYYEWWTPVDGEFQGLPASLAYVQEYIGLHGPFDGVVGFSQGSALLALLNAQYAQNQQRPPWPISIHVSGAPVHVEGPLPFPSIVVVGDLDYRREETLAIGDLYEEKWIYVHQEGHKFPSRAFAASYQAIAQKIRLCWRID